MIPPEFSEYVATTPGLSAEMANIMISTLPGQRYDYYRNSNFEQIKRNVLSELDKYDEFMGFFNVASHPGLL